jgi:hypothetical protein
MTKFKKLLQRTLELEGTQMTILTMETQQDTVELVEGGVVVVDFSMVFLRMIENMYTSYPKRR